MQAEKESCKDNMKHLSRKAYQQLIEWKRKPNHTTLEVSGARQVGKTYLVNLFANHQYQQKIYINLLDLSGELFLKKYEVLMEEMTNGKQFENPVHELIKRQQPDFVDHPDTIIIIDEIQESADIYIQIKKFTRILKSDFIIMGSYLGRTLNKEFKYSSGDLDTLEIQTLNFEEFVAALGKLELFQTFNLFGQSSKKVYQELKSLYEIYCKIGGYPSVVLQYLDNQNLKDCEKELIKIIRLFSRES